MAEGEERQRTREMEAQVFKDRTADIAALLAIPQIAPFFQGLPKNPRLLDLFTGTGAGAQSVYERLKKLDNKPAGITMVDTFKIEDGRFNRNAPFVFFYPRKHSSGREETNRNMEELSRECCVDIRKGDALAYVESNRGGENGSQLPFDLITAFSTELGFLSFDPTKMPKILSIMRIIYENGNTPTIFTFGDSYREGMDALNSHLIEKCGQVGWNLYAKPEEVGHPDWDKWILTNRQLELERFR